MRIISVRSNAAIVTAAIFAGWVVRSRNLIGAWLSQPQRHNNEGVARVAVCAGWRADVLRLRTAVLRKRSDRQVLLHDLVVEVLHRALGHDRAAVHDVELVADV